MRKYRDYQHDATYLLGRNAYARSFYRDGRQAMFWLYTSLLETKAGWAADYLIEWFYDNREIIISNHSALWVAGAESVIRAFEKRQAIREREYYDAIDAANRATNWETYFSALDNLQQKASQ